MNEELYKLIEQAKKDEEADIEKYTDLYKLAMQNNCYQLAGVLVDIKEDEWSHKKILQYFLEL